MSILIPAYRATWLNEAIASALAQTFGDFELLISDDSADDNIELLVKGWSDPRIQYFKNPTRGATVLRAANNRNWRRKSA